MPILKIRDGGIWKEVGVSAESSNSGGASVYLQDDEPLDAANGALWYDTDEETPEAVIPSVSAVTRDLLFSNTDVTSEFPEQTKTFTDLSQYDEFQIELAHNTGTDELGTLKSFETVLNDPNGVRYMAYGTSAYDGNIYQGFRLFIISNNSIQISNCYMSQGSGSSLIVDNHLGIPTKIIGIKYNTSGNNANLPAAEEMMFG